MKDLLLITPPFTQLNTPYPATAYLKGFLNTKNISTFQMDLGIEVILSVFSKNGLTQLFQKAEKSLQNDDNSMRIFSLRNHYINTIDAVIEFLQGKRPTLARPICSGNFLPIASRFNQLNDLEWAFGTMGMQDKAKHLATLYLEDLSDFLVDNIDANFGFSRYAERLGRSANSFDELHQELTQPPTFIDTITLQVLEERIQQINPKIIGFSVPFPGNLYSAFRCAKYIKSHFPKIKITLGGGFPNTELRELNDPRVFDYFDFITLDDGELPLELLYQSIVHSNENSGFKRTFVLENGIVQYLNNSPKNDYKQSEIGTPDYSDLHLDRYISVIEIANPMHSLWSDGRWNKLTMAHGCYWGKCTFCDISLDYIKIYEPIHAKILVDRMEEMIAQTGETGFHFVDEAAPPSLMRDVALEIIKRKLVVTWWTNIRFEKSFTFDLCKLLQLSGCIAVSGGIEVASDRLLGLIKKGITVAQVAKVTQNFTDSGIMVHAYLMYGFPTQTVQETIDSLEMVRQLFEQDVLKSGFWHQFAMTTHSPVGMFPEEFGVIPQLNPITFANNDVAFIDKTGIDHEKFSYGLKKSLFNYMHGICFDYDLQEWFDFKIPKTSVAPNYIYNCLQPETNFTLKNNAKVFAINSTPEHSYFEKNKKGMKSKMCSLLFHNKTEAIETVFEKNIGDWILNFLSKVEIQSGNFLTISQLKEDFENVGNENFELFWFSKEFLKIRENILLVL